MKNFVVICLNLLLLSSISKAQTATFHVINSETHENLRGVLIHSRLYPTLNNFLKTDAQGTANVRISEGDTISLEFIGFYPLHIVISDFQNYDFVHPMTVFMTPLMHSSHATTISDFNNLQTFEYHFVHDSNQNKSMKLQVLEHNNATDKRNQWLETTRDKYNTGFNIVDIKIPNGKKH